MKWSAIRMTRSTGMGGGLPGGLKTSTHPVVSEKAQEMLDKDEQGTVRRPVNRENGAGAL